MIATGPIIVGADGSEFADAAIRWAARDAAIRDADMVVVHAVSPVIGTWLAAPVPADVLDSQQELGRDILERAEQTAREAAGEGVRITATLISGAPTPELVQMSKDARMVVLGSHGRGKAARSLLGSVSMGLVHHAHCPVAVIRSPAEAVSPTAPVVVAVDFSDDSELATELAFEEASRRAVPVVAVHAWWSPGVFEFALPEWDSIRREVEESFASRFADWENRYPDVEVRRVVVRDSPAREITARSDDAQLVVVGSRGHGAVAGSLLGSVSTAVVQAVATPVIVARS